MFGLISHQGNAKNRISVTCGRTPLRMAQGPDAGEGVEGLTACAFLQEGGCRGSLAPCSHHFGASAGR